MSDNPRFYTTSIDAAKTANEIGEIVRQYGARRYGVEFTDDGDPEGIGLLLGVIAFVRIVDAVFSYPPHEAIDSNGGSE